MFGVACWTSLKSTNKPHFLQTTQLKKMVRDYKGFAKHNYPFYLKKDGGVLQSRLK